MLVNLFKKDQVMTIVKISWHTGLLQATSIKFNTTRSSNLTKAVCYRPQLFRCQLTHNAANIHI